ncbi:MAG: hypothetical protein V4596_09625 [Bdellovibrionota bacterium]
MKKLINEVVIFLLIISFTSNTLAANTNSSSDKKPLIAMTPGAETRAQPTPKTFSEIVLEHLGLGPKPTITPQVQKANIGKSGKHTQDKYGATETPNSLQIQKDIIKIREKREMARKFREFIALEQKNEHTYRIQLEQQRKSINSQTIKQINDYYERIDTEKSNNSSLDANVINSREYQLIDAYYVSAILRYVETNKQKSESNPDAKFSMTEFQAYLDTTQKMMSKLFGLSAVATKNYSYEHLLDIHEKLSSLPDKPTVIMDIRKNPSTQIEVDSDDDLLYALAGSSEILRFALENSLALVTYQDGLMPRNADGSIDDESIVKIRDRYGNEQDMKLSIFMMLMGDRSGNRTKSFAHGNSLFALRYLLSRYESEKRKIEEIKANNKRTVEVAANLLRRNTENPVQPELFNSGTTDSSKRKLGIVNADGSLDLSGIELPALKAVPREENIRLQNLVEIFQRSNQADNQTRNGFYYPTSRTNYILKVTPEEKEQFKKEFPELEFESLGRKGNYIHLRLKSADQKKITLMRYKVQPELIKKFSPLMIEKTLVSEVNSSVKHAAAVFPIESVSFYIGMYVNTMLNLSIKYKDDPAALEKYYHEATSAAGQLSFFAFMLGNRIFTNLIGPHIGSKQILHQLLGFLGMGVGSIASAGFHDVISMTKSCAINLMGVDEFDGKEQQKVLQECQATYDRVVSSENMHNYIVSFMNIAIAGGASTATTAIAGLTTSVAAQGSKWAVQEAALATGNKTLLRAGSTLEGLAMEINVANQELRAYSLTKSVMAGGKLTTSSRLASWFGFIPGKEGNLMRISLSFGRLGWKLVGGIVIFFQWDEWFRPYTYKFEQKTMGAGKKLGSLHTRQYEQLSYLEKNNWTMPLCILDGLRTPAPGPVPADCDPYKNSTDIKEQSKLWRDALLYKFMGSYSNWLMYIENYQSQWSMTQEFYKQLSSYTYIARSENFDGKKLSYFNPLLHDDDFNGVLYSDRVKLFDPSMMDVVRDEMGEITFDGMNKLRAQRVIDLLPAIGNKIKEIQAKIDQTKGPKNSLAESLIVKDLIATKTLLSKISKNIVNYLVLSETQRAKENSSILDFLKGKKSTTATDVSLGIVRSHFSKKELNGEDLPVYKDFSPLIHVIDIINTSFKDYTSTYRNYKAEGPTREKTPIESQMMYAAYEKATFFKGLRDYLGNPYPASRGEAFVRAFDDFVKNSYTEEQIKKMSKKTGSVGRDLLWNAVCGEHYIGEADLENDPMKSNIIDEEWGEDADFKIPRLVQKRNDKLCSNYKVSHPTRGLKVTDSVLDYLMRNSELGKSSGDFDSLWKDIIQLKLEKIYNKFDKSYQVLIRKNYIPNLTGEITEPSEPNLAEKINNFTPTGQITNFISAKLEQKIDLSGTPIEVYKKIKAQRNSYVANVGLNVIQTYVGEVDIYLKVLDSVFKNSIKQNFRIRSAQLKKPEEINKLRRELSDRTQKFDHVVKNFKESFIKILLSFKEKKVDVESEYAALLFSYYNIIKSVGIVGDIEIKQENEDIQGVGETTTKIVAHISRSTFGTKILAMYFEKKQKKELEDLVKKMGATDDVSKSFVQAQALGDLVNENFASKMKTRIETHPAIKSTFEDLMKKVEAEKSINNPYTQAINMSLPVLDEERRILFQPAGTLAFSLTNESGSQYLMNIPSVIDTLKNKESNPLDLLMAKLSNQYLAVVGAARSIDVLMEEVYFNVNILEAADINNEYRQIEIQKADKFRPGTMRRN